jgi:hypothetical protein
MVFIISGITFSYEGRPENSAQESFLHSECSYIENK